MKSTKFVEEIQMRLPDDIRIIKETSLELTEDEFIAILSWIKYFNWHYKVSKKNETPAIQSPLVSKRIRLDFYFYRFSEKLTHGETGFNIYICENNKLATNQPYSVEELVNTFKL